VEKLPLLFEERDERLDEEVDDEMDELEDPFLFWK